MKTKLKDNKVFCYIAIPLCLLLAFFGKFIPISGLSKDAVGVLCIFASSLFLWLTIGISWPSIVCIFSLGFIDSIGFTKVFQSSFGNSTFVFLLFTFICTYALSKTSLIKRTAIAFITNKMAKSSGYLFIILFFLATLFLGLFISPSVLFVVLLPILEEIFAIAKIEKGSKIGKSMMLGLGFTCSISSGMTTIAHVFPVLAIKATGLTIDPVTYMLFGIPTGLVIFILMCLMLIIVIPKQEIDSLKGIDISSIKSDMPKICKKDIITLSIFVIVVLLWIIPSFFGTNSTIYKAINTYGTAMPPILGTLLLCIIRVGDEPLITIDEAFKKGVPWTSLIMCASTLALAAALTNDAIGIKAYLQNNLSNALSGVSVVALLIIFASWAALQTNVSSNMVTATLVATVASNIISSSNMNLLALACVIGLLASCAFATPPSMPHIAIVAGSEYASTTDVLIYGGILMVVSIIVSCLIGYPLGTLFM